MDDAKINKTNSVDLFGGSDGNNGLIIGSPGKNPLIALLAGNHIATGGNAVIFDTGSNFRHLSESLSEGQYIDFNAEKPVFIDVFSGFTDGSYHIKGSFLLDALVDFIYSIGSTDMKYNEQEKREVRLKIDEALNLLLPEYLDSRVIKSISEYIEQGPGASILTTTFAKRLRTFLDRYNFKGFVSDKTDKPVIDFNKKLTVIDFGRIAAPDLRNALAAAAIVSILKDLYFNKKEKTAIFIDNLGYFTTDDPAVPDISPLLEHLIRRSRVLNVSTVIATESLDALKEQYGKDKSLSSVILNVSPYKFFLKGQKEKGEDTGIGLKD
ncbi:MAG: hypothetical protein ACYCT6_08940 [bacterium]